MDSIFSIIINEIKSGHQVYFICPLITESETSKNVSLEELLVILKKKLGEYTMEVLHGRMKDNEKDEVLDNFYNNKTNILLSTTVVEVGVNIQNATVMVVMNANSFGLAQLHQLRGRIGRSTFQSYCYLIVDDLIEQVSRLEILEKTDDGFEEARDGGS